MLFSTTFLPNRPLLRNYKLGFFKKEANWGGEKIDSHKCRNFLFYDFYVQKSIIFFQIQMLHF